MIMILPIVTINDEHMFTAVTRPARSLRGWLVQAKTMVVVVEMRKTPVAKGGRGPPTDPSIQKQGKEAEEDNGRQGKARQS